MPWRWSRWTQLRASAMESTVGDANEDFAATSDLRALSRHVPIEIVGTTVRAIKGVQVLCITLRDDDNSRLFLAAQDGHCGNLYRHLREYPHTVNDINRTGDTALHLASSRGYVEAVRVLLLAGAGANLLNDAGWSSMMAAANWGFDETVKELLKAGCRLDVKDSAYWCTALFMAARGGFPEASQPVLPRGPWSYKPVLTTIAT